jgi:alpha/beta superfamily hydrolase
MVVIETLFIKNNEIKLEGQYYQSKLKKEAPVILICHPHPHFLEE